MQSRSYGALYVGGSYPLFAAKDHCHFRAGLQEEAGAAAPRQQPGWQHLTRRAATGTPLKVIADTGKNAYGLPVRNARAAVRPPSPACTLALHRVPVTWTVSRASAGKGRGNGERRKKRAVAGSGRDVGSRLEPFADQALIDTLDNTLHEYHEPVAAGTAISFDSPWDGRFSSDVTVINDSGTFRM